MESNHTMPWETVAKWSAAAFILAGIFRLVNMGIYQSGQLFESFSAPELALDLPLLLAFELAFVGLLGLYPRLAEKRQRLALAGVALTVISGASILVVVSAEYILGGGKPPAYLIPFQIAYFLGIPLSFLVFGGVSIRTRISSLGIGVLLVIGGASWFVALTGNQALIDAAAYIFAIVMLAIGYYIDVEPTADSPVGGPSESTGQ